MKLKKQFLIPDVKLSWNSVVPCKTVGFDFNLFLQTIHVNYQATYNSCKYTNIDSTSQYNLFGNELSHLFRMKMVNESDNTIYLYLQFIFLNVD